MKDLLYQLSYITILKHTLALPDKTKRWSTYLNVLRYTDNTILKYTIPLSLDSESNEQYAKTNNG